MVEYEFLKYGDGNIVRRNHAWDDDAIENDLDDCAKKITPRTIHNICQWIKLSARFT